MSSHKPNDWNAPRATGESRASAQKPSDREDEFRFVLERSSPRCQLYLRKQASALHAPPVERPVQGAEKPKTEKTIFDTGLQSDSTKPETRDSPRASANRSERPPPPDSTLSDAAAPSLRPPPDPPPPRGLATFCGEPTQPELRRFGSASHAGPPEIAQDKGNQDFAFHLELNAKGGAPWVLCGVADGVGQATWSARAARHAAAAFVEGVAEFFEHSSFPMTLEELLADRWHGPLSECIHTRIMHRIDEDRRLLLEGRYVDPTWAPANFARMYWDAPDNEDRIRAKWFQTTLLAAALGPNGGFALFLGDGFVRVDRQFPDERWESSAGLTPTRAIAMDLTAAHVASSLTRLPPRGASKLGVLMTTDGVSNSTNSGLTEAFAACDTVPGFEARPPLERVRLADSADCERVLATLASLPPEVADRDNMSIAFAVRALSGDERR